MSDEWDEKADEVIEALHGTASDVGEIAAALRSAANTTRYAPPQSASLLDRATWIYAGGLAHPEGPGVMQSIALALAIEAEVAQREEGDS